MKPLRIFLADLTYTTLSLATEAFPLNVGFVGAYCKKKFGNAVHIELFKYLDDLDQAIHDNPPDILGASNYPWNHHIGLEFFRMVRSLNSKTLCVMGGPNISLVESVRADFIAKRPEIDYYTYLEGEESFSNIVERVLDVGEDRAKLAMEPVDGALFRLPDGTCLNGKYLMRRKDLDEIPSPYLSGMLDKFFDNLLSPMIETNRGCPFSCTFCHEGNREISKVNFFSMERVLEELDYIAEHVPEKVSNLIFSDPNFAMYNRDLEICSHISSIQKRRKWPNNIYASTGKNRKEFIADCLRQLNGTMKLWMSVQSMDMEVLRNIKRENIKLDQMMGLNEVFEELGVPTYSEFILALPGETYDSHIRTISQVIDSGIDSLSAYTLMLLNGTELTTPESRKRFGFSTHYRVLPRDFGRLSNGKIAVEIEEVVTSTSTMSFKEYQDLRKYHLVINVIYNGKGFRPLFKFFNELEISVFDLLKEIVENIDTAEEEVKRVFDSFVKLTQDELWDSEKELLAYVTTEEAYEKLLAGEIGTNLIQTHAAKGLKCIDTWAHFVFRASEKIFGRINFSPERQEQFADIRNFCLGRIHNLWGSERHLDNPVYEFRYDIPHWYASKNKKGLEHFLLRRKKKLVFKFSNKQLKEINDWIERFGTSDTGIGRILVKVADITRLWREAYEEEFESRVIPLGDTEHLPLYTLM